MASKTTKPKVTETVTKKTVSSPGIRSIWKRSGGCSAKNETDQLLEAICDKIGLE